MERLKVLLFSFRSLTFNSATSRAAVVDTIFEPVFWIIDHVVRILGPVSNLFQHHNNIWLVCVFFSCTYQCVKSLAGKGWVIFFCQISQGGKTNINQGIKKTHSLQ